MSQQYDMKKDSEWLKNAEKKDRSRTPPFLACPTEEEQKVAPEQIIEEWEDTLF